MRFILCICLCFFLASCKKQVNYTPPEGSTERAITHFSYDKLVFEGEAYDIDLIILPDGKVASWAFDRETHRIAPNDLQRHMSDEVTTIIIGCGLHGEGFLDDDAKQWVKELQAKGISVHFLDTIEAVNMYNSSPKEGLLTFMHVRN